MNRFARYAVFAGAFSGPLAGNAVLAVVPILEQQFHLTAAEVLVSISFYMFPFAVFSLISGSISDIYGRRKVVTLGFMIYAAGAFLCAISGDVWTFYISRGIQGFGYAFVNPVLVAILAEIVAPESRGRNIGYLAAATTAGVAFGPLFAGVLSTWDWRWTFVIIGVLCFACNLAILRTYDAKDFRASGTSFHSLPRNWLKGLRDRGVVIISAIGFLNFFCYIGALAYVSDVLAGDPLRLDSAVIGLLVALCGLAGIFAAPTGGVLVTRIGRGWTATLGLAIGLMALVSLHEADSILAYAVSLVLLGTGSQMLWAALLTFTVELIPDLKGTVSSIFNCSRYMGYALSPLLLGPLYMAEGFRYVLLLGASILMVGMILSLLLTRR